MLRARLSDGAVRVVTETPDRDERWPYWSEAAHRVIFQTARAGVARESDLVLWDPDTGEEAPFPVTPARQERWPSWSPDGRTVAYAFRGGRPAGGVALVEPARRTARIAARSDDASFFLRPNFSPDGRLLVAERHDSRSRRSSLWLLSAAAPPRALVDEPQWNDTKAWFTRDGKRIVFGRRPAGGGASDVMSIAVDGGDLRSVVSSAADEHSPRPSPGRDEVVFVSNRDGLPNVFVADLDGGSARNLHRSSERRMFAPRWSPDGERIVTTVLPADVDDRHAVGGEVLERSHIVVLDRNGARLLDVPGAMADWMPPWP